MLKPNPKHLLITRFDEWELFTDESNVANTIVRMNGVKYLYRFKHSKTEYRLALDPRYNKEEVIAEMQNLFPGLVELKK